MSDIYWYALATVIIGYTAGFIFLFNHFHKLSAHQMDLMDIVLKKLNNEDILEKDTKPSELSKKIAKDKANLEGLGDSNRTHLLGGVYANGDAVCHEDCWCDKGVEEE
jgi:hypothetical protein